MVLVFLYTVIEYPRSSVYPEDIMAFSISAHLPLFFSYTYTILHRQYIIYSPLSILGDPLVLFNSEFDRGTSMSYWEVLIPPYHSDATPWYLCPDYLAMTPNMVMESYQNNLCRNILE